ncbi:MAG: endonuclease/exonuclease/phosphatase family protein [Bacteroidales bacterium]|nr:endonuclease/exonuclease/phosphatase family protein [Bacteroidales bacterium]
MNHERFAKAVLLLLGVTLMIQGCSTSAKRSKDLHVVSFNMLFEYDWTIQRHLDSGDTTRLWKYRCPVALETFDSYSFDVVGTQELMTFQIDSLTGEGTYSRIGRDSKGLLTPRRENEAIIYRTDRLDVIEEGQFWYSDTPDVPGSSWGIHNRFCTWGHFMDKHSGKDFYMFNSHFHVDGGGEHKWPDGRPFTHEDGDSVRCKSASLLIGKVNEIVPEGKPVFITGDLNCTDEQRPIAIIREGGFRDSRDCVREPLGPKFTFHGFNRDIKDGIRIDYVFVRGDVEVESHQVLTDQLETGRWSSDHLPVYVTVRL